MANDIIDINVYETVETVEITVNPNLTTVNINQVTGGGGSFTNLSTTQTASNFTINSDTGDDALVPLGNGTLAGATLNDYTTSEKNKLAAITGTNTGDQEIYWTKTGNDIKNNNTGIVEISGTKTAVSNLAQGVIVSNVLTSSANNDSLIGLDVKSIFDTGSYTGSSKILFRATANNVLRTVLRDTGTQTWILNDGGGSGEVGLISYGTPAGKVGIQFYNNTGTGRSDIRHITTGGITIATGTTGSMPSNQFYFYPTGNLAINQSTDAGYRLDVNGTTRLNGLVTATALVKYNSDLSSTYDNRTLVDKGYVNNTFVPYTGATTDVNLGLNDITAEKLIKSGGTSSQILSADGSVITAGNNITITGGQISSVGGAGGGGSSVNYYLNGGTSQGTFGGTTYYEFSKTAIIGTGADFNINSNGYIASFITDVADPSLLLIPAGNWNLEFFFSSSSAGGTPSFYVELYKYDGTTFTLIASSSATPEGITNGTSIDAYFTPLAVPETILTVNDRLAIRVFVNASSKTITLHTQNGHLCEVITTFTAGLTALNGLQAQVQNFATGTTGTDFAINSSGSTHTFNLPSASATARGVVTTASQTFAGDKTFTGAIGASNLSGTNTGDNATNTQYSGLDASKQDTLQSTVNIKSINGNSILGSGDLTISGTGISSLNGLTGATQTFSVFTNFTGSPAFSSSGTNHQLRLPNAGTSTDYGLITNTTQSIAGTKEFLSNPQIPVPAGNTAPCIVLGAAGGGGATGTISIGDTVTYPNGQEIQRVKGVTSNIQTQLDGKANIIDVAEQTYSLSPTFTVTAPTTIVANTYKWSQVGSLVTVRVNLIYTTPASITQVAIPLPADMPTPLSPTGLSGALDVLYYGVGMFNTLTTSVATVGRNCFLRRNATSGYEFVIVHSAAVSTRVISLTLQYFT